MQSVTTLDSLSLEETSTEEPVMEDPSNFLDVMDPALLPALDVAEAQYLQDALDVSFLSSVDDDDDYSFLEADIAPSPPPLKVSKKKRNYRRNKSVCGTASSPPGALEASVKHFYDPTAAPHDVSSRSSLCSVLNCTRLSKVGTTCLPHSRRRQSLPASFSEPLEEYTTPTFESILGDEDSFFVASFSSTPSNIYEVVDCKNRAYSKKRCRLHGSLKCKSPTGCKNQAQKGGYCRKHGGGLRCNVPGCTKAAQRLQKCIQHGGRRACNVTGCTGTDRGGGYCTPHRQHLLCSVPGCKRLRKYDGVCTKHSII